jgi:hypothetical protein
MQRRHLLAAGGGLILPAAAVHAQAAVQLRIGSVVPKNAARASGAPARVAATATRSGRRGDSGAITSSAVCNVAWPTIDPASARTAARSPSTRSTRSAPRAAPLATRKRARATIGSRARSARIAAGDR